MTTEDQPEPEVLQECETLAERSSIICVLVYPNTSYASTQVLQLFQNGSQELLPHGSRATKWPTALHNGIML
jgi:hypothetical protein